MQRDPHYYVAYFDKETGVHDAYYQLLRGNAAGQKPSAAPVGLGSALWQSWGRMKSMRDDATTIYAQDPSLASAEHFAFCRWIAYCDRVLGFILDIWGVTGYHMIKDGLAAINLQQAIKTGGGVVTPSTPEQERWARLGIKAGFDLARSFNPGGILGSARDVVLP